jgi:NAD dependent epimerase/dehydratase
MADRVLITGAGGFIGSHVVEALLREGRHVRALVRYNSRAARGHLDRSDEALAAERAGQLEIVAGDVTDPHQTLALAEGCETILHLAALIGIPYSYVAPGAYQAVNVGGTLNVLEAARRHGARRVVVTSTSEVYGTAQYEPIDERHPLVGQSPYAASKIGADKLAESYHRSFGVPVVVLRPFNTYGPRQSQRAVIPTILAQALGGADEIRLGSLEPRRDMTYVDDTARAFALAAAAPGIDGETIHFGSGRAWTVGELARACLDAAGSRARIAIDPQRVRPETSEVGALVCDARRAREKLAWEPRVGLQDGLARTAEAIRAAPELYRAGDYTL